MHIFEKVSEILSELSGIEILCLEQELQTDLGFDSLQMVILLIALEDIFEEILGFQVGMGAVMICQKLAGGFAAIGNFVHFNSLFLCE